MDKSFSRTYSCAIGYKQSLRSGASWPRNPNRDTISWSSGAPQNSRICRDWWGYVMKSDSLSRLIIWSMSLKKYLFLPISIPWSSWAWRWRKKSTLCWQHGVLSGLYSLLLSSLSPSISKYTNNTATTSRKLTPSSKNWKRIPNSEKSSSWTTSRIISSSLCSDHSNTSYSLAIISIPYLLIIKTTITFPNPWISY